MPEPLTLSLVVELLKDLHVAFPSATRGKSPEETASVYRNGLNDMSGDAVRWAVGEAIRTHEFFPKVAQLRDLASRRLQAQGIAALQIHEADPLYCRGCRSKSRYETRWRPKIDERGQRITDRAGRVAVEVYERLQCGCSAPSQWMADADDDPWTTTVS